MLRGSLPEGCYQCFRTFGFGSIPAHSSRKPFSNTPLMFCNGFATPAHAQCLTVPHWSYSICLLLQGKRMCWRRLSGRIWAPRFHLGLDFTFHLLPCGCSRCVSVMLHVLLDACVLWAPESDLGFLSTCTTAFLVCSGMSVALPEIEAVRRL